MSSWDAVSTKELDHEGDGSLDDVVAYWDAAMDEEARCPVGVEDARPLAELAVAYGRTTGALRFSSGGFGGETAFGRAVDTGEQQRAVEDSVELDTVRKGKRKGCWLRAMAVGSLGGRGKSEHGR